MNQYHTPSHKSVYFGFNAISECGIDIRHYQNILQDFGSIYIFSIIVISKFVVDTGYRYLKYFYFHLKPEVSVSASETDLDNSLIKAYPSPANNYITVECEEAVDIFDLNGKIIFSFPQLLNKKIIDLSLLSAGTYIIARSNSFGCKSFNTFEIYKNMIFICEKKILQ
ncbi:MAG: T9SS type A sorting domain-containing protein [Saprospiraceae bacterium]